MKANINLEIDKEDLNYELQNLVSKIAGEEIRRMVKESAEAMVKEEVKAIIAPIVDSYLQCALVGREYSSHFDRHIYRTDVDKYIKTVLVNYLDEPVHLYDKSSTEMGKRYQPSSSGGEKATRAEQWVISKARKYADTELFEKMETMIKDVSTKIIPSEERIKEIIKAELQNLIS